MRYNEQYEQKDHLGNVLVVISDRKEQNGNATVGVTGYSADVKSATDYYPFGMEMVGRSFSSGDYRYGFNGKEKDSEGLGGGGATYDYGFRIYNPAIGKFLSVDPLRGSYPWYTPYQFAGNSPIKYIDLDGLEESAHNYDHDPFTNMIYKGFAEGLTDAENDFMTQEAIVKPIESTTRQLIKSPNELDVMDGMFREFTYGVGPVSRSFGEKHVATQSLMKSNMTKSSLKAWYKGYTEYDEGLRSDMPPYYAAEFPLWYPLDGDSGPFSEDLTNMAQFVGSARYVFSYNEDTKQLDVTVNDDKTPHSLFLHIPGMSREDRKKPSLDFMGKTYQSYNFSLSLTEVESQLGADFVTKTQDDARNERIERDFAVSELSELEPTSIQIESNAVYEVKVDKTKVILPEVQNAHLK